MDGLISAYGFDGRRIVALRSQLPLISTDAPTSWVHVAYEGQWDGHSSGPFEFTRKVFEQVCANFESQANPVKLDFDHETVFSDGPTPARGWVHDLAIREDGGKAHLWALVEFGSKAVEINRSGGYRFCSGVFEFDAIDRVTGKECGCALSSLALTDEPFIDGQRPIRLSRRERCQEERMDKATIVALMAISKESLAAALDQIEGDEITVEQLQAAAEFAAAKDGKLEDEEEAPMADPAEDVTELAAEPLADPLPSDAAPMGPEEDAALAALAPLMEATGLDIAGLAAAIMENLDAVAAALKGSLGDEPAADAPLSEGGALPPAMPTPDATLSAEVEGLALSLRTTQSALGAVTKERDELAAKLETIRQEEADAAVETYVQGGVVLDNARADMKALYLSNREAFHRIVASMKPRVPVGEHASDPLPQGDLPEISEADEQDPEIVGLRRMLSATGRVSKDEINKAVRERLAARRVTAI